MAAPIGNRNAAKAKKWADALHKALTRCECDGVKAGEALAKIAEVVVLRAIAGDKDAWQEIANRLDGKPHQSMDVAYTEVPAEELDDGALLNIASSGRKRAVKTKGGEKEPSPVH